MEDDCDLEFSPLCQSISSGGKSVQVHIYKGEEDDKWILEVEDDFGNSTVWDDLFDTDYAALTEAKKAILEDGITSFIGPEDGKGGGDWN
jgi:uncharacterized protein